LRIGDQRAISAFTKRLNFAGVRSLFGGIDPPSSVTFALTAQGFVERGRELVDNGLRGVLGPPSATGAVQTKLDTLRDGR
jgi:hypothetical protein